MASFALPSLSENSTGWGPSSIPCAYEGLPYLPYSKTDKLNRIADWTSSARHARQADISASSAFSFSNEDDGTFTIVDTQTIAQSKYSRTKRGYNRPNRQYFSQTQQPQQPQRRSNYQAPRTGKKWKIHAQRYQRYVEKRTYDPSVTVQPEWIVSESIDLNALKKVTGPESEGEDICCVGNIKMFDNSYSKMFARNERPLQRHNVPFFNVPAAKDPILKKIEEKGGVGHIFASDVVIATLMSCTRSVYPWDIIVNRSGDNLYLSRRDKSKLEYMNVGENLLEPPPTDGESMNCGSKLGIEATMVNQFFARQVVNLEEGVDITKNPEMIPEGYETGNDCRGYRYRKFALGSRNLVVRCDVDGVDVGKDGEKKFHIINAVHEYDTKKTGNWRAKLDTQIGAALAKEVKANSCQLAKWSARTMLSGADQFTLGFISRQGNNPNKHSVLKVQHFKPSELANNIAASSPNMWGIVHALTNLFMEKEDGKYVLMKEPNKDTLLLYSVPATEESK